MRSLQVIVDRNWLVIHKEELHEYTAGCNPTQAQMRLPALRCVMIAGLLGNVVVNKDNPDVLPWRSPEIRRLVHNDGVHLSTRTIRRGLRAGLSLQTPALETTRHNLTRLWKKTTGTTYQDTTVRYKRSAAPDECGGASPGRLMTTRRSSAQPWHSEWFSTSMHALLTSVQFYTSTARNAAVAARAGLTTSVIAKCEIQHQDGAQPGERHLC
jgi:hypothetical protein